MKIGIVVALEQEWRAVRDVLDACGGQIAGNEICLIQSGMGKVNAAVRCDRMIRDFQPDCVISTGCAGGLAPGLGVLEIVAASEVVYHDFYCGEPNEWGEVQGLAKRFVCDPGLLEKALKCGAAGDGRRGRVRAGLVASGDLFVSRREESDLILSRFPEAIAVDMESAALAHTCLLSGVPFLSLRVISDSVDDDNREGAYQDFWATVVETSFSFLKDFLQSL